LFASIISAACGTWADGAETNPCTSRTMNPTTEKTIHQLGYGGLVPFVLLTALIWLVKADLTPFLALSLSAYGALIASFLGGIHWGVGFKAGGEVPRFHFVWGVLPSLFAWVALMMPPYAGLPLLGLLLVACYVVDKRTYPAVGLGPWLPMRLRLTVVATLSCVLGAAAV
jgi:hypothetical protein